MTDTEQDRPEWRARRRRMMLIELVLEFTPPAIIAATVLIGLLFQWWRS